MKRLPDQPFSSAAVWTRRLATTGALVATSAVALAHRGMDPRASLAMLGLGLALSVCALATCLPAAVAIWQSGDRGSGRIVAGALLAVLTLAYPGYVATKALQGPFAADLSTDAVDPPPYATSAKAVTARGGFQPSDPGRTVGDIKAVLPDFEPILLDEPSPQVFATVARTLRALRWTAVDAAAPGGKAGSGRIDATAYSAVMHLPEEIAIRLKPEAGQTRVDIRSTSRLGLPDFGDNARNIRAFGDALEDQED